MKEKLLSNLIFIILIVIFSIFFLYPVIDGIIISFTDWKGISYDYNFVGLDNYIMIFNDERTSSSMITTIKYLFLLLPLSLSLGYIGASVIDRLRIFKSLLLFISIFPYIITPVVTCMLWNQLYYKFFTFMGEVLNIEFLKTNILSSSDYALFGVSIVDLWILVPYAILLFYSNLSIIPKDLVNAAKLDGANGIKIFTKIKLFYLLPSIGMISTVIFSYVFTSIDTIMALTNGGPGRSTETFFYVVYRNSTLDQRFAYGTAEGIFISIICILIYILIMRIINHKINNISLED